MAQSFGSGISFQEQINNQGGLPNVNFQGLIFGRRKTDGYLIQPPAGSTYSQPNAFIPFALPYFQDGVSAVNFLVESYGFKVVWGKRYKPLQFPAPTSIINLSNSQYQLIWSVIPVGFSNLVGCVGSVNQNSTTGSILLNSIQQRNGVGTITVTLSGVGQYNTTTPVTITATNPNIQEPNPDFSDEIVVGVFKWYVQNTVLPANEQPTVWLSVLNDNCTTICPNNAPTNLINPSQVTVEADSSVTLTYPSTINGLGYLPTVYFENSSVGQNVVLPTTSTKVVYYSSKTGLFLFGSANNGGITWSSDGVAFTSSNLTTQTVNSFFDNGTVIVVGTNAGIYTSADGKVYTLSSQITGIINKVVYNTTNNQWYATSTTGIYYTADITGATGWTQVAGSNAVVFNQVAYKTGLTLATSQTGVYASTDGIVFTVITGTAANSFAGITYFNNLFIIGGASNTGISYTATGSALTATNVTTGSYVAFARYANSLYAVGTNIQSSATGQTFLTVAAPAQTYTDVTASSSRLMFTSTAGGVYYSTDGTTVLNTNLTSGNYVSIANNGNLVAPIYAIGGSGGVNTSFSGVSFQTSNSASGTYNGFMVDALGNVDINITNVTGAFNTLDAISINLDSTNNAFKYLAKNPINKFCLPFTADTINDLTITQSAFYNGIMTLNNGSNFSQRQFFAQGYYACLLPKGKINTTSSPNNQYFKHIWKGDQPTIFDPVEIPLGIACASAYTDLNVPPPYYGQTNVTLALNASSNSSTYPNTSLGGDCDIAVSLGLCPLYIDNGVVKIYRNVTTLQTINGATDVEFRYISLTAKQAWLQSAVYTNWNNVLNAPQANGGTVLNSAAVRENLNNMNITSLNVGAGLGMFQNVALYQNLCSVTVNPNDPTGVIIQVPNQCVPELSNGRTTVQMYTVFYNFSNQGQ